jgi:hypothetical protein
MAYSDTVALPLLSTGALEACSAGGEYTRVQKILRVAGIPDSYATLDVCVRSDNANAYANCSACWKCLRTLATLEIAGCLERYSPSFDLDVYGRLRRGYFARLLGNRAPLWREVVAFARERNFSFPVSSRIIHASGVHQLVALSRRVGYKLNRTVSDACRTAALPS